MLSWNKKPPFPEKIHHVFYLTPGLTEEPAFVSMVISFSKGFAPKSATSYPIGTETLAFSVMEELGLGNRGRNVELAPPIVRSVWDRTHVENV